MGIMIDRHIFLAGDELLQKGGAVVQRMSIGSIRVCIAI